MLLEELPSTAVAHAMERVDPFLALVDGDGTVHERRASRTGRLPEDLSTAGSLRSVLSPRVLQEWLRIIRSTAGNGCCHSALAILDGVAPDEAVAWVRASYLVRAVATPVQEWWVSWFGAVVHGTTPPPRPKG